MQNTANKKINKKQFKNSLKKKGNIWRNKMPLELGRECLMSDRGLWREKAMQPERWGERAPSKARRGLELIPKKQADVGQAGLGCGRGKQEQGLPGKGGSSISKGSEGIKQLDLFRDPGGLHQGWRGMCW